MKYTVEVVIEKPISRVTALFSDPENMKQWIPGLISFEHLSGTPGQPGAQSKLNFQNGKKSFHMIETILTNDLPHELSGTYDVANVHNIVIARFSPVSANSTLYQSVQEFQFKGLMKIIGLLFPRAFKKQSMKYLMDFKKFAESQS